LNAFSNLTSDETFGAAATAWNAKVSTAISYTASNAADVTTGFSAPVTSQTFTLTTSVDEVKGGAGDDTISGIIGSSGTYAGGDNIIGGAGTDLLKLIDSDSTAAGVVSLEGVEQVNVRMLEAATTTLDASDWNGVATLSNYSSTADSTLSVSGLTIATDISVYDETNVTVEFADIATGAETATVILNSVGSGTTSTVTVVAGGTANVNLDATAADTLAAVNLTVNGTNFLRLEGGDGLRTVTLNGTGNVHLTTDDLIATLDASALTGTNRFTLSGRSEVSVVGGAGKDTFAFGTSLNSYDTINGGEGATDALTATLGNSTVRLNATAVEEATFTLAEAAGGAVDFSAAASVQKLTLAAGTAGNNVTLSNFAGTTINLSDDDIGELTLDTVSGVSQVINLGSSTGYVSISAISVTDSTGLTINTIGSGTNVVSALLADSDIKTVVVSASGSASLSLTTANFSGATVVTLQTDGSASLTFSGTAGFGNTALTTVTLVAANSDASDILVSGNLIRDTSGGIRTLDSVNLTASSGADIMVDGIQMGTSTYSASGTLNNAVTVTITAGNGSDIAGSAGLQSGIDLLATAATLTVNAIAQQSGDIYIENITLGDAGAASATGVIGMTLSADVAQDAYINIADIAGSGAAVTIGAINVGASGGLVLASAGVTIDGAALNVGTLTIDGGSAILGAVSASALGAFTLDVKDGGTATIGNLLISAISTITVNVSSGGLADFSAFGSADAGNGQRLGGFNVNITGNGSADFGAVAATAGAIGDITLNVVGAGSADFDVIAASSVGIISVSGSGWVDIGIVSATTVGGIDLRNQGSGGTFSIDLSGVTNGVIIDGGRGTTTITAGDGVDEYYLKTGLGSDKLVFSTTGQAADIAYRFEAGTADDQIRIAGSAGIVISNGSGDVLATTEGTAASVVIFSSTAAGATAMTAGANLLIITHTAFASKTAMVSAIASGGSHTVGLIAGASSDAAGNLAVVWTDGTDSYVTLVSIGSDSTAIDDDSYSADTLLTISNVTAGALVAANFAFV